MTFTWQYNNESYAIPTDEPLFGNPKVDEIIYIKLGGLQFELEIVSIDGDIYQCDVIDIVEV